MRLLTTVDIEDITYMLYLRISESHEEDITDCIDPRETGIWSLPVS